jgi:Lon protease-like protein
VTTPSIDIEQILRDFGGVARLFPLPSVVVFPDVLVPLKVFEPRFVTMVEDALEDDGLVGMALLKPGYEEDYQGSPDIHPMVCMGKILQHKRLPNGHIDFWLYGVERARVVDEVPSSPFRRARVEVVRDAVAPEAVEKVAKKLRRTLDLVPGRRSVVWELRRLAGQVRGVDAGPGRYADAVANVCPLSPGERYDILAEADVSARFDRLIKLLEQRARKDAPTRIGPKDVSRN